MIYLQKTLSPLEGKNPATFIMIDSLIEHIMTMNIKPFSNEGKQQKDQLLIFSYKAEEASIASNATLPSSCEITVANSLYAEIVLCHVDIDLSHTRDEPYEV